MIENAEKVSSYFGYWPEFCDAKIESFSYNSSGIIELSIFYIDADLNKTAHIALQFSGVTEVSLSDLFSENVIDEISIEGTGPFNISIESCFGLGGSFKCDSVRVADFHA
jgi:hypothetical protein